MAKTGWNVFSMLRAPKDSLDIIDKPYRPSQWSPAPKAGDKEAQLIAMEALCNITEQKKNAKGEYELVSYFFDGFLKEGHSGRAIITEHPVQTGANISDHAYNLPDKLSVVLLVSDAMDCVVEGQFSEVQDSKSKSAYNILRKLKEQRLPLTVRTRLYKYKNMLITDMTTDDDYKTEYSLRCNVTFTEIIMAGVATETAKSTHPHVTAVTPNQKPTGDGKLISVGATAAGGGKQ